MMETPARIEPCGIEEYVPTDLIDLVSAIRQEASEVGRGVHPRVHAELQRVVRIANAYHSNLIEGHEAFAEDIEAALVGEVAGHRSLAEEGAAHVRVQQWIDDLADRDDLPEPTSVEFVLELHRLLYEAMPAEFRFVSHREDPLEIVPGELRSEEVAVGRHHPPSADRLHAFLNHFALRYRGLTAGRVGQVLSIPAAHHRFAYLHPFLDGNGRVGRLMTHAMIRRAGIGGNSLWSISRGLARGLEDPREYMARMDMADTPRQGDRDGRGNLSLDRLTRFSAWFLRVMLGEVRYATVVFDGEALHDRYVALVEDTVGDPRAGVLVSHLLRCGGLSRGTVPSVIGTAEAEARTVLRSVEVAGIVNSIRPEADVRIAFPLGQRARLFPELFESQSITTAE
ncbi:Fic family protein [Jannaschia sp. Os4]|uniref:Fic family protein n=1 Tax=Jannaschia sp. Os4 TaxID=2807617 RepID=UPI001939A5EE|nr:Fic family protein [Jannaschia sp. Os4]MBM2576415.1 Fic family protein [Jannaschia sp. Os4]